MSTLSMRFNFRQSASVLIIAVFAGFTAASCTAESPEPVVVRTSEPALAEYFSWYNAHEDGPPVEIEPIDRGSGYDGLRNTESVPDILIDRHLIKPDAATRYASVEEVVSDRRDAFYRPLIRAGQFSDRQRLIPVSFDVPAIMFSDAYTPPQDSRQSIELEALARAAEEFNEWEDGRVVRMGYSPLWQQEFVRTVLESFGTRFRTGPDMLPLWSHDSVDEAIEFMQTWSAEGNDGAEIEQDFLRRYLVAPGNRVVQEGLAGFWHTTASQFYSMPDKETAGLDVRWIVHEGQLPVADRVLWAAIPEQANNAGGAREVLRWLSDEDTQAAIVRGRTRNNQGAFGFAGGFSAIRAVNHRDLVEADTEMTGRIPVPEQIRAPVIEHRMWPRMREQAAVPWALETIQGEADDSLRVRINEWIRRQER